MAYILTKYLTRVVYWGLIMSLLMVDIVPGALRAEIPVLALPTAWTRREIVILWGRAGG